MTKFINSISLIMSFFPLLQPGPASQNTHHVTDTVLAADSTEYPEFAAGYTVEDSIATGKNFDSLHRAFIFSFHPSEEISPGRTISSESLLTLKELTYNCDAVVLATPLSFRSALTANHKFVFSDYEVRIDSIYFDRNHLLSSGETSVVSRPGGSVMFNGVNVQAFETEYPLFHLGRQYVFFLHSRDSGSFYAGPSHAFALNQGVLTPVRNHPPANVRSIVLEDFVHKIQAAAQESQKGH